MTSWQAEVGDTISVESHRVHGGRRLGEIVEVLGSSGAEYYRVRWEDGRESILHPGSDAVLLPAGPRKGKAKPTKTPRGARSQAKPKPAAEQRHGLSARPGDRLVVRGHHLGEPDRDGEILEALGDEGAAPFRVLWSDTGREAIVFPGPDAEVDHLVHRRRGTKRKG
jgi:hypothetical protein